LISPRIIISGAVALQPFGGAGNTWAFLQYVLGFQELGCEVIYVEELAADSCWDASWKPAPFTQCENAAYFGRVIKRHSIRGALLAKESDDHVGLSRREGAERTAGADLFLNIFGRFQDWGILRSARRRAYCDMDPGFTQI
jgi:hypothetical protein